MHITPQELATLRALIERAAIEQHDQAGADNSSARSRRAGEISPGDVVQIEPEACKTWGGSLLYVTQADRFQVRGYALVPHRGGAREAWQTWTTPQVDRIGHAPHHNPGKFRPEF